MILRFGRQQLTRVIRQFTSPAVASVFDRPPWRPLSKHESWRIGLHDRLYYERDLRNTKSIENVFKFASNLYEYRIDVGRSELDLLFDLFKSDPASFNSLSDIQLAAILTLFSDHCEAVNRKTRQEKLQEFLEMLQINGTILGPLSRFVVFKARIDNGTQPSVEEEIRSWEAAKMEPNSEILVEFARAYSLKGNITGVMSIIHRWDEAEFPFNRDVVLHLIYSHALRIDQSDAITLIEHFSGRIHPVILYSVKSLANIEARDVFSVLANLSLLRERYGKDRGVKWTLKSAYLADVMCKLIEVGNTGAFEMISPLFSTDRSTLSEKSSVANNAVLSGARMSRSEGRVEAALEMYRRVHPACRDPKLTIDFMNDLVERIEAKDENSDRIRSLINKMKELDILSNPMFIEEEPEETARLRGVIERFAQEQNFNMSNFVKDKMNSLQNLRDTVKNNMLRASLINEVVPVLFDRSEEYSASYNFKFIYDRCYKNVNFLAKTMRSAESEETRRLIVTAGVHQILEDEEDLIADEKLEKLLAIRGVEVIPEFLAQQMYKLLENSRQLEGAEDEKQMETLAKIFSKSVGKTSRVLVDLISDERIPVTRIERFVEFLLDETQNLVRKEYADQAEINLKEAGLEDRIPILKRIIKVDEVIRIPDRTNYNIFYYRSFDITKWERYNTDERKRYNEANLRLMLKNMENYTDYWETDVFCPILVAFHKSKLIPHSPVKHRVWERMFIECVQARSGPGSLFIEELWEIRPEHFRVGVYLSYISRLFGDGELERADAVCEELQRSALPIQKGDLEMAGSLLVHLAPEKVHEFSRYLQEKMNLNEVERRRILTELKQNQIKELISSGELEEALKVAEEETTARGEAFGQRVLLKAALEKNDTHLMQRVLSMVVDAHDATTAVLEQVYAILESGKLEKSHAEKLFSTDTLEISSEKLEFFVDRAISEDRPDVLQELIFALHSNKCASAALLNDLLSQLVKYQYRNKGLIQLKKLNPALTRAKFPLDSRLMNTFASLGNRTPSSDVSTAREQ